MVCLKIDPKLGRSAESLSQEPSGLRRNTALATNQLVDPLNRHSDMLSERNLRHAQRLQEFFKEDFSGMCRSTVFREHMILTV
jgi:hypothetical protein